MNQQAMAKMPTTIDEVHALPHAYAKTHAQACAIAAEKLPNYDGPITSRKVFMEPATNRLVYVFYRKRNEANQFFIIF